MTHTGDRGSNSRIVPLAIAAVIALYLVAVVLGLPQAGTRGIVEAQSHHVGADDHAAGDAAAPTESRIVVAPPLWTVIPFVLLLAAIAVLPLIPAASKWWDSN